MVMLKESIIGIILYLFIFWLTLGEYRINISCVGFWEEKHQVRRIFISFGVVFLCVIGLIILGYIGLLLISPILDLFGYVWIFNLIET